jgi:hypothetical protein
MGTRWLSELERSKARVIRVLWLVESDDRGRFKHEILGFLINAGSLVTMEWEASRASAMNSTAVQRNHKFAVHFPSSALSFWRISPLSKV